VQQVGRQPLGPLDRRRPHPFDDRPRLAEAVRVGRVELRPFRVAPVQLGLDERHDIDAVDPDVADLAVDVDILQPRAAQRRAGEVHVAEPRAAEIDLLEPRAGEVLLHELDHPPSLPPGSDTG
jgi:hypothetical protein